MKSRHWLTGLLMPVALGCGSDGGGSVDPITDDFVISDEDQNAIDDAADSGKGAEGTYSHDADSGTITFTIDSSSFDCGPEVGTFTAEVISVDAEQLVLQFEGDSSPVTWTRVDSGGDGLVGIWHTTDPDLYLILSASGEVQIFGEQEMCDDERPRNDKNCLLVEAADASVTIDGDLSDWDAVGDAATIDDPVGDHQGDDPGADVVALAVAFSGGTVAVLSRLAAAPSTAFQRSEPPNNGSYRITIQGYNGLSEMAELFYSPATESWEVMSPGAGLIDAAAGADGIEWSADVSSYLGEGFDSVDFIMLEPLGCADGPCDGVECAYFELTP